STPDRAFIRHGPLRQYELWNIACQRSSMWSGSLPRRNGSRYWFTAVSTTRARWVNVAQPTPYRPGSLVSTFTTTRRIFCGAVRIAFTRVILIGPAARGAFASWACDAVVHPASPAIAAPLDNCDRKC